MYNEHLTPSFVFDRYILGEVLPLRTRYRWIDIFAGNGDLIFPILEHTPAHERVDFFREHIFMCDIQPAKVQACIRRAVSLGIPESIAARNILVWDSLEGYPPEALLTPLPCYHITNPPYSYIGRIVKSHKLRHYLEHFRADNEGYQDLYQIALANDLRHGIHNMIYIMPTNFLFGGTSAEKIRRAVLERYHIKRAVIFEKPIFSSTGTHVMIAFFQKKERVGHGEQDFGGVKVRDTEVPRRYILMPKYGYRAGTEFMDFVTMCKAQAAIRVSPYLYEAEVSAHTGNIRLSLVDANSFRGRQYTKVFRFVDEALYHKVKSNPLFLRTLDTGTGHGRAGLYLVSEVFEADGIVVTRSTYRTQPIQLFLYPTLSYDELIMLKDYFNLLLEHFRETTDSEFMTTYKYSKSSYTRKYLGLYQAKALIETFPYLSLSKEQKDEFATLIQAKDVPRLIHFMLSCKR